jgi:hypothetical protein
MADTPQLTVEEALERINRLRSNVVATQSASWSNMLYPLVAILDAAGLSVEGATDAQRTEHLACYGGAGHMPTILDHPPVPDDLISSLGAGALVKEQAGIVRIMSERLRQVSEEGWTPEHDDEHDDWEMAKAAVVYVLGVAHRGKERHTVIPERTFWPHQWDESWYKPSDDPIRDLEKAGALIAAEIDRLQRAAVAAS